MITSLLPNIQKKVVLAPFTTYKVGGPADYFLTVKSTDELVKAVEAAKTEQLPYFILGMGANILVSDKGFRGLVIRNQAQETRIEQNLLYTASGAQIADLIKLTAAQGLSGLEHYAGIPSTVGGALWQNLHFLAPDRHSTMFIASVLKHAELLFPDSQVKSVPVEFFEFDYDHSILQRQPELVVLSATFELTPLDRAEIERRVEANLAWRSEKHPPLDKFPSSGSIFKKIEGVGAGRLIDQAGLKGWQIGGAQVSAKHANFIVNLGTATATDIYQMIKFVQQKVKTETGYQLTPEIKLVGEWQE